MHVRMASPPRGHCDRKLILAASGIIGSALLLAACDSHARKPQALTVQYRISPDPPRPGPAKVSLGLAEPDNRPLTGAHLKLEGDMSHPGMAPEFGEFTETKPGFYEGSLRFSMAGDWVILVRGTLANGEPLEELHLSVPRVRPD